MIRPPNIELYNINEKKKFKLEEYKSTDQNSVDKKDKSYFEDEEIDATKISYLNLQLFISELHPS